MCILRRVLFGRRVLVCQPHVELGGRVQFQRIVKALGRRLEARVGHVAHRHSGVGAASVLRHPHGIEGVSIEFTDGRQTGAFLRAGIAILGHDAEKNGRLALWIVMFTAQHALQRITNLVPER